MPSQLDHSTDGVQISPPDLNSEKTFESLDQPLFPQVTKRISRPAAVTGKVRWHYVIPILAIHLLALLACVPWLFSWSAVIITFFGIHLFGCGINIGYHRLLTHRSFKCPEWVERVFVFLAVCCMEDAPGTWVATHRLHHKDSDDQPDPHSPLVSFWWSHMGWLMYENRDTDNVNWCEKFARDILKKPFYLWLQRRTGMMYIYFAHALAFLLAGFLTGWLTQGAVSSGVQLGLSWLVWGVFLRTVLVWHITWSVNSLSHVFGYQNYQTSEYSRNNWLVVLLANGEGWHNNHHADPTAASNWHRWWEVDLIYVLLKVMEKVGLVSDVTPPRLTANLKNRRGAGVEN